MKYRKKRQVLLVKPRLTDNEREIILENLIHDLAGLDMTTEREASQLYERRLKGGSILSGEL